MFTKWIIVLLFVLLLIALSVGSMLRTKTYKDFNLAGRRVGLTRLVASLGAAEFNTATLIGAASVSYLYGTVGIWYTSIVFIVVFGVYTLTVAKPYRRLRVSTIAEFFERRYSGRLAEPTRAAASILTGIFTWLSPATYMAGLTVVATVMLGVPPLPAVIVITLFCLALALMGGFMTAVTFDVVAYSLIIVMVPVLFLVGYVTAGGFSSLPEVYEARFLSFEPVWDIESYGFAAILTWGFQTTLLYIAAPWYGQRIFAAKNERVAFTAMGINTILLVVLYALIAATTMFSRVLMPNLSYPEEALPKLAVEYMPAIAQALVLVMLILVGTSTIMAIWNSGVSIVVNDIFRRYIAPNKSDTFYIQISRVTFIALAAVTLILALSMVGNILIALTYVGVATALLAFPIIAGLYWKRFTTNAAFWSLVISTTYVVIALIIGLPYHMISPIGVPIGILVGLAITFWGPNDDDPNNTELFFRSAWTASDSSAGEIEQTSRESLPKSRD
jgi:SSS family solute:Na+ symporter